MATRTKLNTKGVGELLRSSGVRADLTARASRVLAAAESSAPVGETGNYKAGLHIIQSTTDRAVVRVATDVDYGYIVEANTGNLARALDAGR